MISIIIPAHDEEAVIGRCLAPLLKGLDDGDLEIVVACNGCSDATADIARKAHGAVKVLELAVPSKIAALNAGDREASGSVRVFLDADIVTDLASVRAVAREIEEGRALAAAPRMRVNVKDRGFLVRSYYRLWLEVPYFREGMIGCGFYAIGDEGRRSFESFPEIIADDEFIRRLFAKEERKTVEGAFFLMTPPKTLAGIVKINTRALYGNMELERVMPATLKEESKDFGPFARKLVATPSLWIPLLIYSGTRLATLKAARKRVKAARERWAWDRDDSSRE